MKKNALLSITLLLSFVSVFAKGPKKEKITVDQLPAKAQIVLTDSFTDIAVKTIYKIVPEGIEKFFVVLKDKTKIEFDMVGAWSLIEVKSATLPRTIYPKPVKRILDDAFAKKKIVQVENDGMYYRFDFADDTMLKVDATGEIISIKE